MIWKTLEIYSYSFCNICQLTCSSDSPDYLENLENSTFYFHCFTTNFPKQMWICTSSIYSLLEHQKWSQQKGGWEKAILKRKLTESQFCDESKFSSRRQENYSWRLKEITRKWWNKKGVIPNTNLSFLECLNPVASLQMFQFLHSFSSLRGGSKLPPKCCACF